jgi:hypothetical protein
LVRQVDTVDPMSADLPRHRRLAFADPLGDPGQRLLHDQPVRDRESII